MKKLKLLKIQKNKYKKDKIFLNNLLVVIKN